MNKKYTLIVSGDNRFSLSNETDSDPMTDYSPGIWGISTQKSALRYAREILANGDEIRVTDYNNAKYHTLANKFIKELGLKQELFKEPVFTIQSIVTKSGVPSTLGALKKFLTVGKKIRIVHTENPDRNRDTEVILVKNESIVTRKGLGGSHLYFEKAVNWAFDNFGATYGYINNDGTWKASFRIEYL